MARWYNEKLGLVPCEQFIAVAEESRLISQMSEQIMQKALEFMLPIINQGGFNGRVSFNVSISQFTHYDFITWIDTILQKSHFPAEYLDLEITESMVMKNTDLSIKIMQQLKARNISISIDDFGTGYSSLSYSSFGVHFT